MEEKYLGENIGKLGYGNMRLPRKNGKVDINTAKEMIDEFMSNGFSYFDTSYIYAGSEETLRECLVKRYPRERFQIATKIPIGFGVSRYEDHQKMLDASLSRLGVEFVDFYLVHGLSGESIKKADSFDSWKFMRDAKEKGFAKHIGFSFHGTPDELEEIFSKHPEMEFALLQINYLDWENPEVQSRRLYEITRKYDKPFSIMEPTKGGLLAGGESNAADLLREANPNVSVASWAFRFAGALEGLITVLSGMENVDQVRDNVSTFKNFKPPTEKEYEVIKKAVEIINSTPRIPCTTCNYCLPHCPEKIKIPDFIDIYNNLLVHRQKSSSAFTYSIMTAHGTGPSGCISCRLCEDHCPQHIEISEILKKLVAELTI